MGDDMTLALFWLQLLFRTIPMCNSDMYYNSTYCYGYLELLMWSYCGLMYGNVQNQHAYFSEERSKKKKCFYLLEDEYLIQ